MKVIIFVAAFVVVALAAPQQNNQPYIVRYDNDNNIDSYQYGFQTSDGQSAQEQGQLQNAGTENEGISVRGQYSYVGPDGVTYTVTYIADENGFQPQGAHIPQPQ